MNKALADRLWPAGFACHSLSLGFGDNETRDKALRRLLLAHENQFLSFAPSLSRSVHTAATSIAATGCHSIVQLTCSFVLMNLFIEHKQKWLHRWDELIAVHITHSSPKTQPDWLSWFYVYVTNKWHQHFVMLCRTGDVWCMHGNWK